MMSTDTKKKLKIWIDGEDPEIVPRPLLGLVLKPKIFIFLFWINIVVLGVYMGVFDGKEHVKTCFKAIQSS